MGQCLAALFHSEIKNRYFEAIQNSHNIKREQRIMFFNNQKPGLCNVNGFGGASCN